MPWNTNMDDFDSSATTESEVQTPETTPRAWWLSNTERTEYRREWCGHATACIIACYSFTGWAGADDDRNGRELSVLA
jgi:hypothetical protein